MSKKKKITLWVLGTEFYVAKFTVSFSLNAICFQLNQIRVNVPENYVPEKSRLKPNLLIKDLMDIVCPNVKLEWISNVPYVKDLDKHIIDLDEKVSFSVVMPKINL